MKYHNKKVTYDGRTFDSIKEKDRYIQLMHLQEEGEINGLSCQVEYELIPKTKLYRKVSYIADFVYTDKDGREVVEDVKSKATMKDKVFILKKKLFFYRYNMDISIFL